MISFRCTCGLKNRWTGAAETLLVCRSSSCRRAWIRDHDSYRPATDWELDYFRAGRLGRLLMRLGRWLGRPRARGHHLPA